jgi:hypothetical protein
VCGICCNVTGRVRDLLCKAVPTQVGACSLSSLRLRMPPPSLRFASLRFASLRFASLRFASLRFASLRFAPSSLRSVYAVTTDSLAMPPTVSPRHGPPHPQLPDSTKKTRGMNPDHQERMRPAVSLRTKLPWINEAMCHSSMCVHTYLAWPQVYTHTRALLNPATCR